jgi:ribosomal protein L14
MLQMKTSLKVCDKSGVGQVTCIGSIQKKKAFASLLRVILSKNSLKYKLLKKTNYLGICVKSRSWFFGIDGISKRHRANACLLLSKNFKLITGKAAGV